MDVLTKVNTSTSQPNDLSLRLKVVSSMQVPPPTPRRGCGVGGGTISYTCIRTYTHLLRDRSLDVKSELLPVAREVL